MSTNFLCTSIIAWCPQCVAHLNLLGVSAEDLAKALAATASNRSRALAAAASSDNVTVNPTNTEISSQASSLSAAVSGDAAAGAVRRPMSCKSVYRSAVVTI